MFNGDRSIISFPTDFALRTDLNEGSKGTADNGIVIGDEDGKRHENLDETLRGSRAKSDSKIKELNGLQDCVESNSGSSGVNTVDSVRCVMPHDTLGWLQDRPYCQGRKMRAIH